MILAMNFCTHKAFLRRLNLLCLLLFLLSSQLQAQIGDVKSENKTLVGSAGEPNLVLPFLEYMEVTGKTPYYTLWFWDESKSSREIKSLEFYASHLELDYLYGVLKSGFQVHKQRLEVGECRIVTTRPLRPGKPLKITIYYPDDSIGIFYLKETALERLLGKHSSPPQSKLTSHDISN